MEHVEDVLKKIYKLGKKGGKVLKKDLHIRKKRGKITEIKGRNSKCIGTQRLQIELGESKVVN